jgi:hypothetical protein
MDRLLARLERRIGRYAIPNLIFYIVAGMGMVWLLSMARPEVQVLTRIDLDMDAVRHGQVWRLVTFLFLPLPSGSWLPLPPWLLMLLTLYFTWWVGTSLEQHWGAFKFNAYYLVGALGTIVVSVFAGPQTNFWLDASLFLAFATIFPDVQVLLMFILPIKVKWLGILAGLFIGYAFLMGGWGTRMAISASLGNYVLFFWGHWSGVLRTRSVMVRQQAKREQFKANEPVFGQRACALCGAREADGADIRVCSCDKCGGKPRTLCLEHARKH